MAIRALLKLGRECDGAAAVEFALVAPILFLLIVGTAQFGIALNNYVMLTEAVSTGARQLAVSRGAATPRTSTVSAIQASAPTLVSGNITITTTINGTACTTDTACSTALSSNAGNPATVTATYPCDLNVFGINFAPTCTLSSTTAERIE